MKYILLGVGILLMAGVGYAQCPTPARPIRKIVAPVYEIPIVSTPAVILIPAYSFQFIPAVQPAVNIPPTPLGPSSVPATTSSPPEDFWPAVPGGRIDLSINVGEQPISTLFQQKCARCHSMPSKVGVDLFDGAGVLLNNVDRSRIARVVGEGRMPPKSPLNPNEIASVQEWLRNP